MTATPENDRQQRQNEFKALFAKLPGTNIEKIRKVCSILHCEENTVRGYIMQHPVRAIPRSKLKILQDGIAKTGKSKK